MAELGTSPASFGVAKKMIDMSIKYANERKQFGQHIAQFSLVKEKIARMSMLAYGMQCVGYLTAGMKDAGVDDFSIETAVAKVFSTEAVWEVCHEAMQVHGGMGYGRELGIERFMRDSRLGLIIEGTSEILSPEGPAAQGGLQAGDVILEVNGEEVERSSSLPRLIGKGAPGSEVELTVMRDGEELTESVELGSWPDAEQQVEQSGGNNQAQSPLGMVVAEIDDAMREQLNVQGGVVVRQVESDSVAANAGIRSGDVVVSIDHRSVSSSEELVDIVDELPTDRAIPVRLFRDGHSLFVALRLE